MVKGLCCRTFVKNDNSHISKIRTSEIIQIDKVCLRKIEALTCSWPKLGKLVSRTWYLLFSQIWPSWLLLTWSRISSRGTLSSDGVMGDGVAEANTAGSGCCGVGRVERFGLTLNNVIFKQELRLSKNQHSQTWCWQNPGLLVFCREADGSSWF